MFDGGALLVLVAATVGIVHKGIVPMVNRLRKLSRIEKKLSIETVNWLAEEDFK